MSVSLTADQCSALLATLTDQVIRDGVGSDLPVNTRLPDSAIRRLWLGMVSSAPGVERDQNAGVYRGDRIPPPLQGVTFAVDTLPVSLSITVNAAVVVALHPNADEQREAVTPDQSTGAANRGFQIVPTWAKAVMDPVNVSTTLTQPGTFTLGSDRLSAQLGNAQSGVTGARFRPRRETGAPAGKNPRPDDFATDAHWSDYTASETVDPADLLAGTFAAEVSIDVLANPAGGYTVTVVVINRTAPGDTQECAPGQTYPYNTFNDRLYDVELNVDVDAAVAPIALDQVADSFRYDRHAYAFGQNCAVDVAMGPSSRVWTVFAATEQTWRSHPREQVTINGGTVALDVSFDRCIADPVAAMSDLVAGAAAWAQEAWSDEALARLGGQRGWDAMAYDQSRAARADAFGEVDWLRAGLHALETNAKVRRAFVLANMAMRKSGRRAGVTAWYPFQAAWILGCLPGMVDPGAHRGVDILWFGTGGGKTEAYVGLALTTLFFSRLDGATAGSVVWARFPLRLLSLNQTSRLFTALMAAEHVRRGAADVAGGDEFSLGYFVGSRNTPNKIMELSSPYSAGIDPTSASMAARCTVITRCPTCDGPVAVAFDTVSWMMRHSCTSSSCPSFGPLPLYVVDDDITRVAPSLLVGTVDKLAQLAHSSQFQVLLGKAMSRCPVHGFTADPTYCRVFGCQATRMPVRGTLSGIRLEIADELHLLEESLGALDGMYETLLDSINTKLGNAPMRVVGSTATIEGYVAQAQQLYARDAKRFPTPGPTTAETFWAYTDHTDPLRMFVGVRPRGVTMVTATREIALSHHRWLTEAITSPQTLIARLPGGSGLDPGDAADAAAVSAMAREAYEVFLAYCLRTEDLNSFAADEMLRPLLATAGSLRRISGDATPDEIRDTVNALDHPPTDPDARVKMVAATRAIGHGVDVARFGVEVIMGTPSQAAEIIQASARCGRRWPGLVFTVSNPSRDRDASAFRYYRQWIRFLDRLVADVPVNRESVPVLRRVLPGGLAALVLQVYDVRWRTGGRRRKSMTSSVGFKAAVDAGFVTSDQIVADLIQAFGVDDTSVYFAEHRQVIAEWVDTTIATVLVGADASKRLSDLLHPSVPQSLRDTDVPLTLYANL